MGLAMHKRRNYLIHPRIQLLAAMLIAGTSCVGTMLLTVLNDGTLTRLDAMGIGANEQLLAALQADMHANLLYTFLAVVPLSAAAGILFTFRIVGPLYRMTQHLRGVTRGEDVGECRIRRGDELQDFCKLLNQAIAAARRSGRPAPTDGEEAPSLVREKPRVEAA